MGKNILGRTSKEEMEKKAGQKQTNFYAKNLNKDSIVEWTRSMWDVKDIPQWQIVRKLKLTEELGNRNEIHLKKQSSTIHVESCRHLMESKVKVEVVVHHDPIHCREPRGCTDAKGKAHQLPGLT